jgi:Glycosyl hydrolase family 45
MAGTMAVVGFGVLASCTSGDIPDGEEFTGPRAGQGNASAGNNGQLGTAGSTAAGTNGVAGAPVSAAGAGGSAVQGTAGANSGGSPAGGAQGQSGSTSTAGAGAGGKGGSSGATGTSGAAGTAGANTGPQPLPEITGASTGFATRYWDCCKPSCGSSKLSCGNDGTSTDGGGNQSACAGGNSFMCYGFAPFQDPANKYVSYAYAASHRACGSCWELQFTGKSGCSEGASCPGTAANLLYNTLFVQVINTGDIADDQFDLLVPGGGVGQFNACSNEWGTSDLGSTYGGFLSGCNGSISCTQTKCNTVFANKPALLAGCNWFLTWYGAGDNPQIKFKSVSCPSQLTGKSGI